MSTTQPAGARVIASDRCHRTHLSRCPTPTTDRDKPRATTPSPSLQNRDPWTSYRASARESLPGGRVPELDRELVALANPRRRPGILIDHQPVDRHRALGQPNDPDAEPL